MIFLVLLLISIFNFNGSLGNPAHSTDRKPAATRISMGLEANDAEYPYIARLRDYRDNANAYCTGSVIHEKWILTAGHCLTDYPQKVTVGTNWASGYGGKTHEIKETFVPDNYVVWADITRRTGKLNHYYSDNDVGLVQLKTPIDLTNPSVAKIPIDTTMSNYEGQATTYVGWGKTKKDVYSPADRLQFAQARVMSTIECQKAEPKWVIRNRLHICTSPEFNSTICPGDSGAPLVQIIAYGSNKQIGIANHGTCGSHEPSVFQKVSAHHPWIRQTIEKHGDTFPYE